MEMSTRFLALPLALGVLALGPAIAEANSRVAGDFDGDGHDDLAIGVPNEDFFLQDDFYEDAGAVNVIYGSPDRLAAEGNQFWYQGSPGIEGELDPAIGTQNENWDQFGSSLAAGDFDGDGFDDLAVGVPGDDGPNDAISGALIDDVGGVNVIYGSQNGLTAEGNQLWHQGSAGIADAGLGFYDGFGQTLTAADLDGDGHDDLAIGVPSEDVGGARDAGAVNVIYGAGVGLRADGNQFWHQDSAGIADFVGRSDLFGVLST